MKKLISVLCLICMCVAALLSFSGCSAKPIVINYAGGVADANIPINEKTELETVVQTIPTREGYVFAGWYSDPNYTSYINPANVTKQQKKAGTAHAKWIVVEDSVTYGVRENVATITDTGRSNQQLDKVGIADDYNVTDLIRAGYKTLNVKVTLTLCEVDDGYQYIFLYSDENCKDSSISSLMDIYDKYVFGNDKEDPSLLYGYKYEHDPDNANTAWDTISFETTLELSKLKGDIFIRYGASGNKADTWKNKDVIVTVEPKK